MRRTTGTHRPRARLWIILAAVLLALLLGLVVYLALRGPRPERPSPPRVETETEAPPQPVHPPVAEEPEPDPVPSGKGQDLRGLRFIEEPVHSATAVVVYHQHYTVSYNIRDEHPCWVAYCLTADETRRTVPRENRFRPDAAFPGMTATHADFTGSGFDRGHLAPAADMGFERNAMRESFLLSNICPQHPNFNRGIWKRLEQRVRNLARRYDSVYVVTGPLYGAEPERVGREGIFPLADSFFKALLLPDWRSAIAIVLPHDNQRVGRKRERIALLQSHAMSIDELERLSGLDLFALLPDSIEDRVEALPPDFKTWGLQ